MVTDMIATLLCLTGLFFAFSTGLVRPRIVNGEVLNDISDYLYVVTLASENRQLRCGGTLIDPRHVITSAHCFSVNGIRMAPEIIIGSNTFIIGGTRYKILSARMHPYYNATETEVPVNDIAIITLAENVKEVTEFPKRRRSFFNDYQTPCKILGKGALGFPKNFVPSIKLKLGLVKQVPKSVCKQYWSDRVEYPELAPHTFCMTSNDAAFCSGDSGGPLLCEGELTGIAFFARYCGTGKPDLYVDILAYNDWIDWVIDNEKYHFCHHG